jgi:hypothetical protein
VGSGGTCSVAVGVLTYVAATGRGRRRRTPPCQAGPCNRLVPPVVFIANRLLRPPARDKEGGGSDTDVSAMASLIRRPRRSKVGLRGHSQDVGPCASGVITGSLGGATPAGCPRRRLQCAAARTSRPRVRSGLVRTWLRKLGVHGLCAGLRARQVSSRIGRRVACLAALLTCHLPSLHVRLRIPGGCRV